MITLNNIQNVALTLNVDLAGGSGTRTLSIPAFGSGTITEAEYTQNPDYYNGYVTQGQLSMNTGGNLNDVTDEPLNKQIGTAVSGDFGVL